MIEIEKDYFVANIPCENNNHLFPLPLQNNKETKNEKK